jgi:hypothetical protein
MVEIACGIFVAWFVLWLLAVAWGLLCSFLEWFWRFLEDALTFSSRPRRCDLPYGKSGTKL